MVSSTHAASQASHAESAADNKTTDEPFYAQYTIPLLHISNMILTSQYNEKQLCASQLLCTFYDIINLLFREKNSYISLSLSLSLSLETDITLSKMSLAK